MNHYTARTGTCRQVALVHVRGTLHFVPRSSITITAHCAAVSADLDTLWTAGLHLPLFGLHTLHAHLFVPADAVVNSATRYGLPPWLAPHHRTLPGFRQRRCRNNKMYRLYRGRRPCHWTHILWTFLAGRLAPFALRCAAHATTAVCGVTHCYTRTYTAAATATALPMRRSPDNRM